MKYEDFNRLDSVPLIGSIGFYRPGTNNTDGFRIKSGGMDVDYNILFSADGNIAIRFDDFCQSNVSDRIVDLLYHGQYIGSVDISGVEPE